MALKQEHRMLRLKTPLGENELVATGFRGHEEIPGCSTSKSA